MIEDIEQGKINMVVVKDLSRLGRNYNQGQYAGYVIQGGIGGQVDIWAGGDGSYVTPIFSGNMYSIGNWMKSVLNSVLPEGLKL